MKADMSRITQETLGNDTASYDGDDDLLPIAIDQAGKVVLGLDTGSGRVVGSIDADVRRGPPINRPSLGTNTSAVYFDTLFDLPVIWSGTRWMSATGGALEVEFQHDFSDDADGIPTTFDTGQTFIEMPSGGQAYIEQAYVDGGMFVADDSGEPTTAAYSGADMGVGNSVTAFYAEVSWQQGVELLSGSAGIIVNPNGISSVADIVTRSIHIIFRADKVNVEYIEGTVVTLLEGYTYPEACRQDGTKYTIGWRIDGNDIYVLLPNGLERKYTSATLVGKGGRYAIFEHYWLAGQGPVRFHRIMINA